MKPNNKNDERPTKEAPANWELLRGKVLSLTGMTEMEYAEGVYESGLAYLGLYWQNDERWTKRWSSSRTFWLWWRNQWALKDELLVVALEEITNNVLSQGGYIGQKEKARLKEVYWIEHSERRTIAEIKPNPILYKLIGKEVKQ